MSGRALAVLAVGAMAAGLTACVLGPDSYGVTVTNRCDAPIRVEYRDPGGAKLFDRPSSAASGELQPGDEFVDRNTGYGGKDGYYHGFLLIVPADKNDGTVLPVAFWVYDEMGQIVLDQECNEVPGLSAAR